MMKIKRNFLRAISAALDTKSASIASLLLQVFGAYACPEAEPTVASWMEKALSMRNRDLILQIRNPRRSGSFEATTAFQEACAADDLVAVRMFVEEGLMPLHCTISYGPQFTPIQIAVTSRSAKSVELLLKMGADPNGECVYDGVLDRPLWLAMESNDEDIVHLLLEHGVDLGLVMESLDYLPENVLDNFIYIEVALIEAQHRQDFYVRSTKPITEFAADAEELVALEQVDGQDSVVVN